MPGRLEDPDLIRGASKFVADFADASTLRAGFIRSYVPHGRIVSIESDDLPEGTHLFTAADLDMAPQPGKLRDSLPGHMEARRPILAEDVVRFDGEAVALVVGPTEAAVEDAIDMVWVDIEELPAASSPEDALTDEVILHPAVGTNLVIAESFGDPDPGPWDGLIVVDVEVDNPRVAPLPLESLAILASPTASGMVVYASTQTPHRLQIAVAQALDLPPDEVRVVKPDVGGAFGQKGAVYVEYLAVARASQLLSEPVLWGQARRDNLRSATHGRGSRHRVRLGGLPDGTLKKAQIEIVTDLGAYPQMGGVVPVTVATMATGPYALDALSVNTIGVLTNRNPTGPYRGAGRPEATYAMERAIDAFAAAAGVQPEEVRRRSLIPAHTTGVMTPTGIEYDSGDYRRALDLLVKELDPAAVRAERDRRFAAGETSSIGVGLSSFVERAGGPVQFGEHATVSVSDEGNLRLSVGSAASGQGHQTVFSKLVAHVFDADPSNIEWISGDTSLQTFGGGTYGSRSGQLGGSATLLSARALLDLCREVAADHLEASPDDIVAVNGKMMVNGVPGSEIDLKTLARLATQDGLALERSTNFTPGAQTFPFGAHGAVVEVDTETGAVTVVRIVAVDDCGRILDPMIASGQVHGSLAQGLGQAMHEAVAYDERGGLVNGTLMDYLIPTASEVPNWELRHTVTPAPSNPLGAKGIGESGTIGLPPALVNAALDALQPYGVASLDMPLTPARVWAAIAAAGTPTG